MRAEFAKAPSNLDKGAFSPVSNRAAWFARVKPAFEVALQLNDRIDRYIGMDADGAFWFQQWGNPVSVRVEQ